MALFKSNGCILEIGTPISLTAEDLTEASFASQTWTKVGRVENLGQFGDAASEITFDSITENRQLRLKGTRSGGSMDVVVGLDEDDAGQLALIAAEKTDFDYAVRVTFPNAPAPKSSTVTMTIAGPGVISWAMHGLVANTPVRFTTTGALPSGLVADTTYYVSATGLTTGAFSVSATPGGATITTTGTQSGTHTATTVPVGGRRMFAAQVATAPVQADAANSVVRMPVSLWINSNTVSVARIG